MRGEDRSAVHRARLEMQGVGDVCAGDSARSALSLIQGVADVRISEDFQTATVEFDPAKVQLQQFTRALRAVGLVGRITT